MAVAGAALVVLLFVLLGAASGKQKEHRCRKVALSVSNNGNVSYIERADVLRRLAAAAGAPLINKPITQINLGKLETALRQHRWVEKAELFFDNNDVLHIRITERTPVARMFTTGGASFYIDSNGARMPLMPGTAIRLPVVTGFTAAKRLNANDSAILHDVISIIRYINSQPFWKAQLGTLNIRAKGQYEAAPVVGSGTILLGGADNLEEKLQRLMIFYKQVLAKTGFGKYDAIDVQYENQVLGIKGSVPGVDSAGLRKNITELIEKVKRQQLEDSLQQAQLIMDTVSTKTAVAVVKPTTAAVTKKEIPTSPDKTNKAPSGKSNPKQKPKAVMKRSD